MECPSCFEIYDDLLKTPRNMPCGHTYCEDCLDKWLEAKGKIECPACRLKIEPYIKPKQLSKNYVAADLARKQRELQKKLQFCPTHNEAYRFWCETDQVSMCSQCIIEHSGHIFVKQEHSIHILKEKIKVLRDKYGKKMEELEKNQGIKEQERNLLISNKEEQLKLINFEFQNINKMIEEKKESVLKQYNKYFSDQLDYVQLEIAKEGSFKDIAKKNLADLQKFENELESKKVITNDLFVKEMSNLEETMNENLKSMESNNIFSSLRTIKIVFDSKISQSITNCCKISIEERIKNAKINFFGEKNKVLSYHIEKDEWHLQHFPNFNILNKFEFSYYSSAVTIPNGKILLTGGGINSAVYEISMQTFHIKVKKSMKQVRKEHGSVYACGFVFVLGGYDSSSSTFLSTCEKFNIEKNEWQFIKSMNVAKCAFAVTAINDKYIFSFGGYDGKQRLNWIEKYEISKDEWSFFELKMPQSFSNGACYSIKSNEIVLLGGGYNSGFSLEVLVLDIEKKIWSKLPKMNEGKDLRNKLAFYNNCIYAIGGNNFRSEKYSFTKGIWENVKGYAGCVQDNLDSWSCALSFETEEEKESDDEGDNSMLAPNNYNYQEYAFDPYMIHGDSDSHSDVNQNEEFDF